LCSAACCAATNGCIPCSDGSTTLYCYADYSTAYGAYLTMYYYDYNSCNSSDTFARSDGVVYSIYPDYYFGC
ncbi:unnamed protein product, partial [Adineta steineri]